MFVVGSHQYGRLLITLARKRNREELSSNGFIIFKFHLELEIVQIKSFLNGGLRYKSAQGKKARALNIDQTSLHFTCDRIFKTKDTYLNRFCLFRRLLPMIGDYRFSNTISAQ